MKTIKQLLDEVNEKQSKIYDSKFIEEGNFVNSFHCETSFKQGTKLPSELLLKACEALEFYATKRHPVYQQKAHDVLSEIRSQLERNL